MVRLFDFKSDKHFVASSDKTNIHVYELTNPNIHPSRIRKTHWREVANITPAPDHHDGGEDDEDQSDPDEDDAAADGEEESYNGLMFFDGHGKIEGQEALTKLAQHLTRLRLIVSPQGHSYQDVSELGEHKEFGIHYLRLNDLFNWTDHGVSMAGVTMWRRLVLKYIIPKREKRAVMNGAVSKDKYEELKKMVSSKDKELGKLREEMEEQDREIQLLKEEKEDASEQHEAELRELEKEKDEELRILLKKKDDELKILKKRKDKEIQTLKEERVDPSEQQQEKLRELEKKKDEELREMMKRKGDELQMLEKRKDEELKKKNDELKMLNVEKDDGAKLIKEKDEELKTLRDQVENLIRKANKGGEAATDATAMEGKTLVNSDEWHMLKKDKEALQKSMNEKDVESGKLRKEKEDLTIANAAETRKLKDQLLQLQEQEQRRNQPWALTYATRYLSEYTVDLRTRRPVPHDTWRNAKIEVPRDHYYVYESNTTATSSTFPIINWIVVNEEPKDWPPPPKIGVLCQPGQFDKSNWWFVKTFHPDGRLAMMAYYDGSQTSYTNPNYQYPIRLAFPMNSKLYTTTPFFLIPLNGVNKLAFSYRD
ncbi:unnamed protein product [Linum tenue]|uniref:Uncharacterized protein n=1 Tax=Linum tenue TaxID=586396 RepID=A0AAV0L322_9ROSI|nr:unnamed protein product [Linum tenue]